MFSFGNAKKCCCWKSINKGTCILLVSSPLFQFLNIVVVLYYWPDHSGYHLTSIIYFLVVLLVSLMGYESLKQIRPKLFIPYIIYRIFMVIQDTVVGLVLLHTSKQFILMVGFFVTATLFLDLHTLDVVLTCYKNMKLQLLVNMRGLQVNVPSDDNKVESNQEATTTLPASSVAYGTSTV